MSNVSLSSLLSTTVFYCSARSSCSRSSSSSSSFFPPTAQHVRVVRDSSGLFQSCVRSFSVLRCCCPPARKFRSVGGGGPGKKPPVKPIPLAKHRQIAKETQRLLVAMKIRRPPRTFYKGIVVQPQGTLRLHTHCPDCSSSWICTPLCVLRAQLCSSMFGEAEARQRHRQTDAFHATHTAHYTDIPCNSTLLPSLA